MASDSGATAADDILKLLKRPGRTLTDAELANKTGRSHQAINYAARVLEAQGLIIRRPGPDGAIHNVAKTKMGAGQGLRAETRDSGAPSCDRLKFDNRRRG